MKKTLEYINTSYQNDKEIVLSTIKQNENVLQFTNNDLKNDKEVVLANIEQNKQK